MAKSGHYLANEHDLRRFRLLGLRKVLMNHTTSIALDTILEKLGLPARQKPQTLILLAKAANIEEKMTLEAMFQSQTWPHLRLAIWQTFEDTRSEKSPVISVSSFQGLRSLMKKQGEDVFFGILDATDYYGPNYATDLILGASNSEADIFGKAAMFAFKSNELELENEGAQYQPWARLRAATAIWRKHAVSEAWLKDALADPGIEVPEDVESLSVDEFSYIRGGAEAPAKFKKHVDDIAIKNTGKDLASIETMAREAAPPPVLNSLCYRAEDMARRFNFPKSLSTEVTEEGLVVSSSLEENEVAYCWSKETWLLNRFPLRKGDILRMEGMGKLKLYLAVRIEDENRQKLLAVNIDPGRPWKAEFPEGSHYISMAFRIMGPGNYTLASISSLPRMLMAPVIHPARLHLYANVEPDTIRRPSGLGDRSDDYDIFIIRNEDEPYFGECAAGEYIAGSMDLLEYMLQSGKVAELHVHYISDYLWGMLKPFLGTMKIIFHMPDFGDLEFGPPSSSLSIAAKVARYGFFEKWPEIMAQGSDIELVFPSEEARSRAFEIGEANRFASPVENSI